MLFDLTFPCYLTTFSGTLAGQLSDREGYLRFFLSRLSKFSCICAWPQIIHLRTLTTPSTLQGTSQLMPEGPGGPGKQVVNVNNLLVPEDTQLKNGDFVIRSRELLKI
jgi:hypothetical protein